MGKSSLTNYLVGEKGSYRNPETADQHAAGLPAFITKGPVQYVLMDTPGIHKAHNKLDARMTQTAAASLKDVDVTLMLFEPQGDFTDSELTMINALQKGRSGHRGSSIKWTCWTVLRRWNSANVRLPISAVLILWSTVSAKDGTGCDDLFALLKPYGNEGPALFR